jgi:hypothetical protein
MKLKPDVKYKVDEFNKLVNGKKGMKDFEQERHTLVNREELFRLRNQVEAHITESVKIFRCIDNLIKQGSYPEKQQDE